MKVGQHLGRTAFKISAGNRARKWRLFNELYSPAPDWAVIDVGFDPGEHDASHNYLEKHYPYPAGITALTIADVRDSPSRYPDITIVRYDGVTIPFDAEHFDILWSNAVIEHVGDRQAQVAFARELDRVAKRHFVTTPNRWFLFETHTRLPLLHYLPKRWFDRIATRLGMGWATGDYMHLLSRRQFVSVLREAGIHDVTIHTNRFLGIPMDYVATW